MKFENFAPENYTDTVAPHAGAWIEIASSTPKTGGGLSPPTRGRGLK